MRTRTLLLLAVVCGLAILLAGGIQLLRLSDSESADADDLRIGDRAAAGDATVTVLAADEASGELTVSLRLGGVDDPEGIGGFTLVVSGDVLRPLPPSGDDCTALTEAEVDCTLRFDTSDVEGRTRVLLVRRGEDQRRWSLA